MVDDPNQQQDDGFFLEDDTLTADPSENYNEEAPKQSFKEVWRSNPSLKVFVIVVGLAILVVSFLVFGSDEEIPPQEKYSAVASGNTVTQAPGTDELSPAYEDAVRAATAKRLEEAAATGGSALPTPIARPAERIEAPVQIEDKDPLSEWRREAEARRAERKKEEAEKTVKAAVTPVAPPPLPVQQPLNLQAQQVAAAPVQQAPPPPPPLPTAPTAEQIQAYMGQIQGQVQTVLQTQVPKESTIIKMTMTAQQKSGAAGESGLNKPNAALKTAAQTSATGKTNVAQKPIITTGTIAYAQTLIEANSDIPGPVLAEVASGPLVGGRAIGTFSVADDKLVIQFNRVIKDGQEYSINGMVMDPATTLTAMSTSVNQHYFTRVLLPAAASFIQAYAQAATQQDTEIVVNNGTVVAENQRDLSGKEQLLQAVNVAGQRVSTFVNEESNRPITVKLAMGTRIGILFMSPVYDPQTQTQMNQQQQTQQQQLWGQALMNATPAGQAYNAANNVWGSQQQTAFGSQPQQVTPQTPPPQQQQPPLYLGQTQQPGGWQNMPQMFLPPQQ